MYLHLKRSLLALGFFFPIVVFADGPLWIRSRPGHEYLRWKQADFVEKSLSRFGLADSLADRYLDYHKMRQTESDRLWTQAIGVDGAMVMHVILPGTQGISVSASRALSNDGLTQMRDWYMDLVGEGATLENSNGVTIIKGPQKVEVVNGVREVSGALPFYFREYKGWMFSSHKEAFLKWRPTDDLASRLRALESKLDFYESQPAEVSMPLRKRLLQESFTLLDVKKQRRDGESSADHSIRISPLLLWETYLQSQFFESARIVWWKERLGASKGIRYRFELTALKDSALSKTIRELRSKTPMATDVSAAMSAAICLNVPDSLRSPLAGIVTDGGFDDDGVSAKVLTTIRSSLTSGTPNVASWLSAEEDGTFSAHLNSRGRDGSRQGHAIGTDSSVVDLRYGDGRFKFGKLRVDELTSADGIEYRVRAEGSPLSEEPKLERVGLPSTVLISQLDIWQLAQFDAETPCGQLYGLLELLYLQQFAREMRPSQEPPNAFSSEAIRDSLRKKISADDSAGWNITLRVEAHAQKRLLVVDLRLGESIAMFLTASKPYAMFIANETIEGRE